MAYLLDTWDAVELFCRIVSRKEGIHISEFQNNSLLIHELNRYSNQKKAEELSIEIIDNYREQVRKKNTENRPKNKIDKGKADEKDKGNVRLIYQLSKDIRYSVPVKIEDFPFNACLEYINNKKFQNEKRVILSEFVPSAKQRTLEGTKWWLYFYDDWNKVENGKIISYKGISRSILYLNPFGKAEIVRDNPHTSELGSYHGIFRIYGHERYLTLKMKLRKSIEREMRIVFYIGSNETFHLAVGFCGNIGEKLWTRTVMIEPIKLNRNVKLVPGFFSKTLPSEDNVSIPDYVWEYFDEKETHMLTVPKEITNIVEFYKWERGGFFL